MQKILLLITLCCFGIAVQAQTAPITRISIKNEEARPVENATVELLLSKDSSLVKTDLTDAAGVAELDVRHDGDYLLMVSAVGYNSFSKLVSINGGSLSASEFVLKNKAAEMQTVTVTARKPFIQKLSDRIVVNVENSVVNAGTSAFDVLEKSPGVTIDQNDAIALRGRQGVIIMIDGKPSPMSGADLANYLRGLPVNAIERIDLITNPSAKYDAAGNSGIIEIRMKKDQRLGYNGTATAGYSQGILPKYNGGTTFNYRNKKMNVFGNYTYSYREFLNHLYLNRNFYKNGVFQGSDDKDNYGNMAMNTHNARVGADFFPSEKTTLGFVVNSNFNSMDRKGRIGTIVRNPLDQPEFNFSSLATNDDHFSNTVGNVNLKHKFNDKGKEVSVDVDYGTYTSSSLTRTATRFFNNDGSTRRDDDVLDGDQAGKLTLRTAKADYSNPLAEGEKLEAGFKTSYVSSDNDAKFFNVYGSTKEVDETKTNHFLYEEYNNAGYLNYSKAFKKWDVQLGLRGEQTKLKTRQVKGNLQSANDYFMLFPSAFVNYKIGEENTVGLSVSRRIDRPGYSQLNPFLFQIDATVYATGNPQLRPQTTWSYEGSYTLKNLNFTLGYSHTSNVQNVVISKILDVIPTFEIKQGQDSNITVQIPVNLSSNDYLGLTASLPAKVTKWWNTVNNLNVFYNHFNGNIGGAVLDNGNPAVNIRSNNNFTLGKDWQAEMNGNYNSGGQYGYMRMQPTWSIALGAQKSVLNNKGTIRLNVSDIFFTSLPKGTITYEGSYLEHWHAERDARVANLTFTYRFGNAKVQQARRRTTASEEERQRAGN